MQQAPAVLRGRTAVVAGASSRLAPPVATALHGPVDRLTRDLAASRHGRGLRVNGLVGDPADAGMLRALALLAAGRVAEPGRTIALGDEGRRTPSRDGGARPAGVPRR